MWAVRHRNADDQDVFASSVPGRFTSQVGEARKFSLPADAECWIDSHGDGDRDWFDVVKLETTE